MGYQRKRTVLLKWGDDQGELSGLEVRAKRISVRKFLRLMPLLDGDLSSFSAEEVAQMEELFLEFGRLLAGWNLEDEDTDEAIPCTPEAFLDQDPEFVIAIVTAYSQQVVGVSAPLDGRSPSGVPSPEVSIPMEVLSPSLAS